MSCVDKKDANRISASKSGRNPAQRIRPESEEIPTRVQFSPQGGNGTVVGISELCDTFPYKHHSTGSKALWTKRPYGGKSGGPSETNEGNNLYFEEWNDGVTP